MIKQIYHRFIENCKYFIYLGNININDSKYLQRFNVKYIHELPVIFDNDAKHY